MRHKSARYGRVATFYARRPLLRYLVSASADESVDILGLNDFRAMHCISARLRLDLQPRARSRPRRPKLLPPACPTHPPAGACGIVSTARHAESSSADGTRSQPVVKREENSAKCWSECQHLNLRPPRPERVAPGEDPPRAPNHC